MYNDGVLCASTVKSFNFMDTKFRGLTLMDIFMDTLIPGFYIILNITNLKVDFISYSILLI